MGLRKNDLKDLLYNIFEIDSFSSKMGSDDSIVTISFTVYSKAAADDLAGFLERGYSFILDADATTGEQSDGHYKVFIELEREKQIAEQIVKILDDLKNLSGLEEFKFRYYKNFRSKSATIDELTQEIPVSSEEYNTKITENKLNSYQDFFNRSFLDEISMFENHLFLKKKWADPLNFEFIDFGDAIEIKESQEGTFDVLASYPEIMYLTKYIGDYAVSKYGENIVLENEDKALVLRRLQ
jgi:hypothetical protein